MITITSVKNLAASGAIIGALGFASVGLGAGLAHADDTASAPSSSSTSASSSATINSAHQISSADAARLQAQTNNLQASTSMVANTLDRMNNLYSTISHIGN